MNLTGMKKYNLPRKDFTRGCGVLDSRFVQRMQNFAVRVICNNYDYINFRGIDMMKQFDWQTIEERRKFHIAILIYKYLNGMAPSYLSD